MADQKINALPTKKTPTSGDKVLMIGTAEEYQMLVEDLATAVLKQLTSQTFALDQGTKTLIDAIDELNSKTRLTAQSISQPSDVDGIEITLWTVTARRIGRAAYIQFNVQGTITSYKTFITLFALPEELRPTSTVMINYIAQSGEPMLLTISSTTGEVQIYANVSSGIEDGFLLRQSISFICTGD